MVKINYPAATTGLRINCFYDKILYDEFKKKFKFDYPKVESNNIKNEKE